MNEAKTMEQAIDERRFKTLFIDPQHITQLWFQQIYNDCIRLPLLDGVPEDVRPVGVWYDQSRAEFAITLCSKAFAPVARGVKMPEINAGLYHAVLELTEEQKAAVRC